MISGEVMCRRKSWSRSTRRRGPFSLEGREIAQLVDNYAMGTQNNKDQASYHKMPITSCVIHPEAK